MNVPHRCPKCEGKGWLQFDPAFPFAEKHTSAGPWQCNACWGTGILWAWAADPQPVIPPPTMQPWILPQPTIVPQPLPFVWPPKWETITVGANLHATYGPEH